MTQDGLNILVIISHQDIFCKTVAFTVFCESREVTCSFKKMLENFFWTSSLLIQLLFRYFFKDLSRFTFKLLPLLHFRFPRACIFQNTSFSHLIMVAGLSIKRQLTRWETVVLLILFTFLGCLRLPKYSIKIWTWCSWGKMKSLTQHFGGCQYQIWLLEFMLVFFFYDRFK